MKLIAAPTDLQAEEIAKRLQVWRLKVWVDDWKDTWLLYGPASLVNDDDIVNISRAIHEIFTIDDLERTRWDRSLGGSRTLSSWRN
ncbi:hypothetical protein BDQ17DRAFT_1031158 [Cyathus striatus]|nr:hypothetical protein BDQ17DRAFT_1031158 [Cyathus striatus]